ncbi:serine hydrolase [Salegentibacter sp. F14]
MKIITCIVLMFCGVLTAQEKDTNLQDKIEAYTKNFNGTAGVYVYNLKSKKQAGVNADTIFPTASIVKIPILIGLFDKIEKGHLSLNDTLLYRDSREYGGSGLMQFYKDSTLTDLRTLAALMITYSDNVTSIWSQELAGGGTSINPLMKKMGMEITRVNSRTKGREKSWEKYGWGQTTPREMATLLVKIRNRELISEAASDQMYRMLTSSFYTDYALSQIPPYIQAAAKQGMVSKSRSEAVLVNAPSGDYVFYIATKNNSDTSWDYENEAWELQRNISKMLWNYFEPESNWEPAENSDELVRGLRY